jgi:hypothetical protein
MHISDTGGDVLYYTATLADDMQVDAPCDLKSTPYGTYVMRTTGALNPYAYQVTYEFCGVKGSASSQLKYEIDCDGDCVPIEYLNRREVCSRLLQQGGSSQNNDDGDDDGGYTQETIVTLQGSINIEGISHTDFTNKDLEIIRTTLEDEFHEAKMSSTNERSKVGIESWSPVSSENLLTIPARKLGLVTKGNAATYQINFHINLVAEHFNVDGSIDKEIQGLAVDLTSYVHHSIKAGLFSSRIQSKVSDMESSSLKSIRSASLELLSVVDKEVRMKKSLRTDIEKSPIGMIIIGCVVLLFVVLGGVIVKRRLQSHQKEVNDGSNILVTLPSTLIHASIVNNGMSESTHREI